MKKILILLSVLLMTYSFSGCKKDLTQVTINSKITANQLSPLSAGSFALQMSDAANTFQTFTWTKVDYGFPTAISYTIQIDKRTGTFTTPIDVVTVPNLLQATVTVGDFNKILLNLGMSTDVADSIKLRIKTVINPTIDPVYSNVVRVKVLPYAIFFPPIYATGAATGGWSWDLYTYKELRSSAPNIYSSVIYFTNNQAFRFFKQTDWNPVSYNFPYFTGTVSNLFVNANDGDSNFQFTGTSGYYQVTVNMTTKSVSMASVPEPTLFMTGQALGGWDWTTHFVKLTWLSNGIYRATATFTNSGASSTFRFFAQQDWSPTGYNYPYFSAGTISNLFVNANDGDKNFQFTGTTGNYEITVNMLDLIVSMVAKP
jgi:hypothetical protein